MDYLKHNDFWKETKAKDLMKNRVDRVFGPNTVSLICP